MTNKKLIFVIAMLEGLLVVLRDMQRRNQVA